MKLVFGPLMAEGPFSQHFSGVRHAKPCPPYSKVRTNIKIPNTQSGFRCDHGIVDLKFACLDALSIAIRSGSHESPSNRS